MRLLLPIALIVVIGCARVKVDNANPLAGVEKPSESATSVPAETTTKPGKTPPPTIKNVAKKPTPAQLSALDKLKNAAYDYYGLALTEPLRMEIVGGGTGIRTGTQTVKLIGVEGDRAFFDVVRTGGLSDLGDNELRLEKDGVFVQSSTRLVVGPADMELPSDLTPGKSWSAKTETKDGGTISVTTTSTVQGPQPLKTKVATYPDALYVTATGEGLSQGQKVKLSVKQWFVKGRGAVKSEFTSTFSTGTKTTYVIQEIP